MTNVHIICSFGETDRILPRKARMLAEGCGWTLSGEADPDAEVNYYFPYLEVRKNAALSGRTAGFFTHNETLLPGKAAIWDSAAQLVDLRITNSKQYEKQLQQYGETVRIPPPLDRDLFKLRSGLRAPNLKTVVGISGYVYSGGRKGEQLIGELLKTPIGQEIDWRTIGRGWPRQLKTETIARGNLPAFYQGLDLYVCPSLIEGVPYGPIEALACGVPVVIPRGVGLLDELGEMQGITRYEAGNVESLADALKVAAVEHNFANPEELRAVTEPFTTKAWVDGHLEAFGQQNERGKRALASDHGIYVVAYGEPARDCAERLITSIREHMPGTPVAVASDRPLSAADLYVANPDEDLGGRAAKTKMWANAPAEWEYVLYLDADTELIAPIPFLFDVLRDGWEVVCTKDVQDYDLIHSLFRRDSTEHRMGWKALGSDRALQLAGGVMGFRRTPAVQAFLEGWYVEWFREARRDQGALLRSLYVHPVRLLVLGNHWNHFEGKNGKGVAICPEISAGILHYRGGPARRVGGWTVGRLDASEAMERSRAVQPSVVLRRRKAGVEGVIRSGLRRCHASATVKIVWHGTKPARRSGRTGRNYIFPPGVSVAVTGEDARHIASSNDPAWEVSTMNCPVCQAPNGTCTGDDIKEAKESKMDNNRKPMRMPKQHVRNGIAGYVGETEGLVETFEKQPRFPDEPTEQTIKGKLAEMTDDQLAVLGVSRVGEAADTSEKKESDGPKEHPFQPNRGGVNCLDCRRSETNGNHTSPVAKTDDAADSTPDSQKLVGKRKATTKRRHPVKRHTPKAKVAAKG